MWVLVAIAGVSASLADTVSISGVVRDRDTRAPLSGVQLRLQSLGVSTTSDPTGMFRLASQSTSIRRTLAGGSSAPAIVSDGVVAFLLEDDARVSVRTFDLQGSEVASFVGDLKAGSVRLPISGIGAGTFFHMIRIGNRPPTILKEQRYGNLVAGLSSDGKGHVAQRTLATLFQDTIIATIQGYGNAMIPVSTPTATGLEILLDKSSSPNATIKSRVIHTSDFSPNGDPDDWQSLVHMLVNTDLVDLEGFVVTTSCWVKNNNSLAFTEKFLTAYEQSYSNLKIHSEDFPSPAYLKSIFVSGQTGYSMGAVGAGKDTPGSELIIKAVDKDDPRPVWVTCWGGCNTLAQSIFKVKNTRTKAELDKFVGKIRVYDVLGQDETGAWMTKTFPELFYIRATGVYGWAYSDTWIDANIQNKGPLGKVYPDRKYATEGDSPAFLHSLAIGLNDPEKVDQGGWGGRFEVTKKVNIAPMEPVTGEVAYKPFYMFGNTSEGGNAIKRWFDGLSSNFAARMIWSVTNTYAGANHHPVAIVNGDKTHNVLYVSAKAGSDVVLDGAGSSDPDKNSMSWSWTLYAEPSSEKTASISGGNTSKATVKAPAAGKSIHIILILKDNGTPALTAYRRVVITGN